MKPVMLATDGSPTAEEATQKAIELAKLLGAPLVVVTAWDIPYSTLSADDLADFEKQNDVFEGLAPISPQWAFSVTFNGEAEQVFGTWVAANFFNSGASVFGMSGS